MKALSRNKLIALIAAIMVLSSSAGIALAYFSSYDKGAGEEKLVLGGTSEVTEEFENNNKIITIKNTGETNIVVRVAVFGPDGTAVEPEVEADWTKNGDFLYYNHILAPGASASKINATIDGIPVSEDIENFDIIVAHESAMAVTSGGKVVKPDGWDAIPNISETDITEAE